LDHREADNQIAAPAVREAARRRLVAGAVFVPCCAALALAVYLKPDPRGFGTHAQLGFGPCGVLIMTGYPCPTCGMTTAFAHAVRGQLGRAFLAQPAGLVLALGVMGGALVSAWTLATGRWPRARLPFVTSYRVFFALLVLLLASWGFKIVVGLATGSLPYR
jgi:hypothetical protein